jgi:transposase-like protein
MSTCQAYRIGPAQRNGHRPRTITTTAGDLDLKIPRLRTGSFFPSLLERLQGTSTRKVDDLVKALGTDSGISKSEVSRICAGLDTEVAVFRCPCPGPDGLSLRVPGRDLLKARVNHRVISQAVVVAAGVAADGHREVLGFRCRGQRRRRVLDCVPAIPEGLRPAWRPADHLRRARRAQVRDRLGAARRGLAAVPDSLKP